METNAFAENLNESTTVNFDSVSWNILSLNLRLATTPLDAWA